MLLTSEQVNLVNYDIRYLTDFNRKIYIKDLSFHILTKKVKERFFCMKDKKVNDVINEMIKDGEKVILNQDKEDSAVVVARREDTVTVNTLKADDVILDPEAGELTKKEKVANIVWTTINIVTNIAFLFFLSEVMKGFNFVGGFSYDFDVFRIVGIVIFVLAQVSGIVLFKKFFSRNQLRTKLIMATMPITMFMLVGGWVIFNIDNFKGENELALKESLNLQDFDPSTIELKYVVLAGAIYLAVLYFVYGWIVKSSKRKTIDTKKNPKK